MCSIRAGDLASLSSHFCLSINGTPVAHVFLHLAGFINGLANGRPTGVQHLLFANFPIQ
jgi:hypothetical protein